MKFIKYLLLFTLVISCQTSVEKGKKHEKKVSNPLNIEKTSLIVLGNVQDGGSPHIGCKKDCCKDLFLNPDKDRMVVSLGLVDFENEKNYLFEATPDLPQQIKILKNCSPFSQKETPDGIFITHAHIGHYTGLMYLGKESMGASKVPVYTMPRMRRFLEENGPWSQLVRAKNIEIQEIFNNTEIELTPEIKVIPYTVPHRDEYSETVGFTIKGKEKSALFIPDIDKWEKWEMDIKEAISKVEYAFIDGTFFNAKELNTRDISLIPHPFIIESLEKFKDLKAEDKDKVYFIHLNHTNRVLDLDSEESKMVEDAGFHVARFLDVFEI